MAGKYQELDHYICMFFKTREGHPTNNGFLLEIAKELTGGVPWRLIDRRIQQMRKNGRIRFVNRKWVVND